MTDESQNSSEVSRNFLQSLRHLIGDIFSVHDEVEIEGTSKQIRKDVVFKGFNIWILILSILICSIGLNLNSTAIIIGAMLISPLMGPITGIGFAVGTFDRDLLFVALKHFFIAVIISVIASFVFFYFAPIGYDHSELDSRTTPGIMDLFVALFGGFAGILAGTRGSKTNVIPGVAIATALMPPLCTAGFGLATGQMNYFLGAAYLFFINSVFISLAALLVVRYLRFPIAEYVNPKLQRRGKTLISFFVLVVAVPSVIIYSNALRESVFKREAVKYVDEQFKTPEFMAIKPSITYGDTLNTIELFVYGRPLSQHEKDSLIGLSSEYRLGNTYIAIHNMGTFDAFQSLKAEKEAIIGEKQNLMDQLQLELLEVTDRNTVLNRKLENVIQSCSSLQEVSEEAKVLFPKLSSIDYAIKPLDDSLHQVKLIVLTEWDSRLRGRLKDEEANKLEAWVRLKYQEADSVSVLQLD